MRMGAAIAMAKGHRTSRAVMEQHSPETVESDDAQTKLFRKLNFFPTWPWAARAIAEIVLGIDPLARTVEEPACGIGSFGEPLREYFDFVGMSDIHDYGRSYAVRDFLAAGSLFSDLRDERPDWVMTNPPFRLAGQFLERALQVARRGVAFICPVRYLECGVRYDQLYSGPNCLTLMAPFIERVPMVLGRLDPKATTTTAYAGFFFLKGAKPLPIRPIPPGTMARLTRPDDIRRFVHVQPMALFEGAAA